MPRKAAKRVTYTKESLAGFREFYQTSTEAAFTAIANKFTAADWAVWAYLQALDPFGDRLKSIPNPKEIGEFLGFSPKQIRRSIKKLEEFGFYETEIDAWKGRNLLGSKAPQRSDKIVHLSDKFVPADVDEDKNVHLPDKFVHPQDKFVHPQDKFVHPQDKNVITPIYKDRGCAQTSSDSDQTHTEAPPEPGAPPTQETVCVESKDSELKRESTAVNPCDEQPDKTSSLTTTVSSKTKDVAASRENSSRHQKNLDHSEPLPWETDKSPREFNTGFEEWMQRSLSHYPAYQGLTSGEMVTKVRKHISAGKYDEKRRDALEIEWAAYQDSMKPKPTSQPPVAASGGINKKPSPEEEATRLRNFRIKFLKSIPEGRVMFIPKWTAKAVQDKELALSDIPQWIQESIQESMEF